MVAGFYATIQDFSTNETTEYFSEREFYSDLSHINNGADVALYSPAGGTTASYSGNSLYLYYNDPSLFTISLIGNGQVVSMSGNGLVNVDGSEGADGIFGNGAGNRISGGDGADELNGRGGADTLAGGAGDDTLAGGAGDDTFWVDDPGDRVIEARDQGYDTVYASISYSLQGQHVERIELTGAADINATGNYLANTLVGNEGVNILSGGKGDDVYYIQTIGDRVIEGKGEGHDTVYSEISYSVQGQYVENVFLTGEADIDATGNFLDNFLGGNDGANHLYGGKGNDTLDGGFGAADTLEGGAGDDHYDVRSAGDRVIEGKGDSYDIVFASVDFALTGQYIEELVLVDEAVRGVGNSLANGVTGSSLDNILDGWSGMDTLFGGGGADTFVFSTKLGPTNVDTIWDFATGVDKIQLNASVFSGLTAGGLSEEAFHIGLAAHDADDRIIYDSASGALFFDRDGSGDRYGQIQFATLNDHPGLNFSDVQVV